MGEFGFVQTVEDNIKLFSKQHIIAGAVQARDLYERLIYPSTSDFRAIVSAGGVLGLDVTTEDVKTADVIWGQSVLKMKGNMARKNGKCMAQSIVKVPKEFIKLQQDVELAIDCSLSINTSSSPPLALRYASPRSLISHTGRKH